MFDDDKKNYPCSFWVRFLFYFCRVYVAHSCIVRQFSFHYWHVITSTLIIHTTIKVYNHSTSGICKICSILGIQTISIKSFTSSIVELNFFQTYNTLTGHLLLLFRLCYSLQVKIQFEPPATNFSFRLCQYSYRMCHHSK